jgi:hypothetical protein
MRPMPATATHEIIISPAYDRRGERLAGRFNARLGQVVLIRDTSTPFYCGASELLTRGLAKPDDVVVMKFAGARDVVLQASVGAAAKQAEAQPKASAGASNAAGSYSVGERDPRRW